MNTTEKQVTLSVEFAGAQTSRGSYDYYKVKTSEGEQEGVVTERKPTYSRVRKQIILKDWFIEEALINPPPSMRMKPDFWRTLPEDKRIGMHVVSFVKDMYPERITFTYEII